MKFFGWMQNKLGGKPANGKSNPAPVSAPHHKKQESREEFSDWPHGLLAIGTFGNNDPNNRQNLPNQEIIQEEDGSSTIQEEPTSSEELDEFTPEEVGKLQKELTKLLSKKPNSKVEKELANLPLDRFLNCPSSLEVDRRIDNLEENLKDEDIDRTISVILGRCKDICAENKKKSIGKKSISFLLKKMFVCHSGFGPQPSLRDTLQESRMEKLLRTLLHKKLYSQSPRASSMKRFIEDSRQTVKKQSEEDAQERMSEGHKWVKTDSEYIVLEI